MPISIRNTARDRRPRGGRWLVLVALLGFAFFGSLTPAAHAQGAPAASPPAAAAPPAGAPGAAPGAMPNTNNEDDGGDTAAQAIDVVPRPTAIISGSSTWEDGFKTLTDTFDKIHAEMGKAGLQAGGRPFAVFVNTDDQGFHFDAMIPLVAAPPGVQQLSPDVRIGVSPSGKALKFQHRGAYDDIDSTYEAITAFLDEKDLEAKEFFVEEYLNDIRESDDENLAVDIYVFLQQ